MSEINLKELFKEAADIASVVPENMQSEAFNRALELLQTPLKETKKKSTLPKTNKKGIKKDETLQIEEIDSTRYPKIDSKLGVLENSLYVLQFMKNDQNIDGLSSSEIANILTEKFRISTSYNAVSMALKNASKLTDRNKKEKKFYYKIMKPGEEYLIAFEKGTTKTPIKSTGKKRSKKNKRSPKTMVAELINDGYFQEWKTIKEIRDFIEVTKGEVFHRDTISTVIRRLLKSDNLIRRKNKKGTYEYSTEK